MSHYEERLEQDLGSIRSRVAAVAESIEKALKDSIRALLAQDDDLAAEVILGDLAVNREIRAIDADCRRLRSVGPSRSRSPANASSSAAPAASMALAASRWAPPTGSGTIPSTTPSSCRSSAVSRSASAAASAWAASRHRIDAHPSGEMTE